MPERGQPNYDRLCKIRHVIDVCKKERDEHQTKICCVDEIFLNLKGSLNFRRFISLRSICIGKENPTVDFQNIVTGDARHLSVSEEIVVYFVFSFLYLDKESQNTKVVQLLSYGHDKQIWSQAKKIFYREKSITLYSQVMGGVDRLA